MNLNPKLKASAAAAAARSPSRWVTRPIKYTTLRSVTTIMVRDGISLVVANVVMTLEVIQVSLLSSPNEAVSLTTLTWLDTDFTLWVLLAI